MTLPAIPFAAIDPVLIEIGPLAIRWYALAYIAGILLAWFYVRKMVSNSKLWVGISRPTISDVDDFVIWATVGIIIGGRLGYVLFYNPLFYLSHPLEIAQIWKGGMSFHGGSAGILVAILWFAKRRNLNPWQFFDMLGAAAPIGLFFGRIANFINSELWGRLTDVPWGFIVGDSRLDSLLNPGQLVARHPSQLYEAFLEGLVLFLILFWLIFSKKKLSQPGFVGSAFIAGYGIFRIFCEFFREPDAQLGFLLPGTTMGMLLSIPMVIIGIYGMYWFTKRSATTKGNTNSEPTA